MKSWLHYITPTFAFTLSNLNHDTIFPAQWPNHVSRVKSSDQLTSSCSEGGIISLHTLINMGLLGPVCLMDIKYHLESVFFPKSLYANETYLSHWVKLPSSKRILD